jgi:hypothetical protein
MGSKPRFTYLPLDEMPEPGDIVYCRWPRVEARREPGPEVRMVLIRSSQIREDPDTGEEFGLLGFSYITSQFDRERLNPLDLYIVDWDEIRTVGLHKQSRLSLHPADLREAAWCKEYFVPPPYIVNRGIRVGRLTPGHIAQLKACLLKRGRS